MKRQCFSPKAVHRGDLILVNAQFPYLAGDSAPELSAVGNTGVCLAADAARQLTLLLDKLGGWASITPVSGWRSEAEQQAIWDKSVRDSGLNFTRRFVALPGHSEHQTGLAIDLGLTQANIDFIRPDFPDTGICGAFRALSASYGFIARYPAGKEQLTGISPEPWHFRYVGVPHAEYITAEQLTLEEYHAMLKEAFSRSKPLRFRSTQGDCEIFPVSAEEAESAPPALPANAPFTVSGDNVNGFIVTVWKEPPSCA